MTPARRRIPPALATSTCYLLRLAQIRAQECYDRVLPAGTQARDLSVVTAIELLPGLSQQDFADRLGVNRTVMVKLIDRLESADLVIRRRNPHDRRSYCIETTPRAQQARSVLAPLLARAENELLAPLSPVERTRTTDLVLALLRGHGRAVGVPDEVARRPGFVFSKGHLLAYDVCGKPLEPLGLTVRHVGWLHMLADLAPCSQRDVATALGVSGTVAVEMTDDLELRGMVDRLVNPADRRCHVLRLTDAGCKAMTDISPLVERAHADLVAPIGSDAADELNVMLRAVAGVAEPAEHPTAADQARP